MAPVHQVDNNGNSTPGTTNPVLWNGLNGTYGAINSWNNVKNGSSYSGYYIQYNCSSPDITIGFADHAAVPQDCATSSFPTNGSGQATITASDWLAQSQSNSDIAATLAHEIGHILVSMTPRVALLLWADTMKTDLEINVIRSILRRATATLSDRMTSRVRRT